MARGGMASRWPRRLGTAIGWLIAATPWVALAQPAVAPPSAAATSSASSEVVPPPPGARSLEVIDDGAPLFVAPEQGAARRGTVAQGTRLPLDERLYGNGCPLGVWYEVGPEAYVCQEYVRYSAKPAGGESVLVVPPGSLLPHQYAFVRWDATRAFSHPSEYFADEYFEALGEGFGLVVTGRTTYQGVPFVQTRDGLWVTESSLEWVRGSPFQGVKLADGAPLDIGWVLDDNAPVRDRPRGKIIRRAGRREVVHVAEVRGRWVRLTDGGWMDDRQVARATTAAPPEGLSPGERWIDVSTDEQVMVAYEGDKPVYATLVSTGRSLPGHRTPKGTFHIWAKLAYSDMDNLEREDVRRNYSIQQVPWVQYFEGSNGFHAAFWHDDFGHPHSHGCVNLAPRDARWLFDFTRPALPAGWQAVLPTDQDPGTLVRVR